MGIHPKQTIDFDMTLRGEEVLIFDNAGDLIVEAFKHLQQHCHAASYNRGWWHDPITGLSLIPGSEAMRSGDGGFESQEVIRAWFPFVVATKIALIHSEVSELLEAHRTDAKDDKIDFPGVTAEAADIVIRICDLLGMLTEHDPAALGNGDIYDLGLAILAKIPFNGARPDHSLAARALPGGKKY